MDGWLKALISAACIVVISGGAYFGWAEYSRYEAHKAAQRRANERYCAQMIEDLSKGADKAAEYNVGELVACVKGGYAAEADFQRAGLGEHLEKYRHLLDSPS